MNWDRGLKRIQKSNRPMTAEERLEEVEKKLMCGRRLNCWLLAGLCLVIGAWVVGWAFRSGTAGLFRSG